MDFRKVIFFFVLILRQNRYLPLNSDHLLGKQLKMLRYSSQPSKISYLRFGDVYRGWLIIPQNNESILLQIPRTFQTESEIDRVIFVQMW